MGKREEIVEEAGTWLKTPWHHMARVKGAGVDCANFLAGVYHAAGLVPDLDFGHYPIDWHLHQDEPRFLRILGQHADPIDGPPLPGDVAMYKFGRHAAHGTIVLAWPLIIHAYRDERAVVISDGLANVGLAERLHGFWRVRGL